jgi:recombinational DNA repair ATPase RecF
VSGSAARLVRLAIRNFRNLTHLDLTVPPDGLVVIGENGQGKTNLLESIHYLQILRSVRGARDSRHCAGTSAKRRAFVCGTRAR